MKKTKIKVNYVDFILAGLILLILATLISMFFSKSAIVDITTKDTIIVTLKIDNIKSDHNDLIKPNGKVYIGDDDEVFGKIKSIKYHKASQLYEPNSDDIMHPVLIRNSEISHDEFSYSAIVEVECQGLINGTELEINNQIFKMHDVLDFCVQNYSAQAAVINFNKE